jgi:hypothetical protein
MMKLAPTWKTCQVVYQSLLGRYVDFSSSDGTSKLTTFASTTTLDLVSFPDVLPSMTYAYLHGTLPRITGTPVQDQPPEKCCSEVEFLDVLKTSYCESIRQGLARLPYVTLGHFLAWSFRIRDIKPLINSILSPHLFCPEKALHHSGVLWH